MSIEPFELRCIKREIESVRSGPVPVSLSKITIHATDAIWLVDQIEKLQKIADAWSKGKEKMQQLHSKNLVDIKI